MKKFDVYEYKSNGDVLFSNGVTREFGQNVIVFVDGHKIIASVMPLHGSEGLNKIGYMVKGE